MENNDKSFAMQILEDYKKQTKRQFVIICIQETELKKGRLLALYSVIIFLPGLF